MYGGASRNVLAVFWWTKTKKTTSQSLPVARIKSREENKEITLSRKTMGWSGLKSNFWPFANKTKKHYTIWFKLHVNLWQKAVPQEVTKVLIAGWWRDIPGNYHSILGSFLLLLVRHLLTSFILLTYLTYYLIRSRMLG